MFRGTVPLAIRAGGGTFVSAAPLGAAFKQLAAHATLGIAAYGNMITLLAATGNTTDAWVHAIVVGQATAAGEFNIAITQETGAGAPTAAQLQAVVPAFVEAAGVAGDLVLPVNPPVYFAAGTLIQAAIAGTATKKLDCAVILSRNR